MTRNSRKPPPLDAESAPEEYSGPERRKRPADAIDVRREIRFDAKGNPVWEVRVESPRRRRDDETFDLLKCLDADELSLELEDGDEEAPDGGYELYKRETDD